jgi:methionine synthase II (cobalamin-independent)
MTDPNHNKPARKTFSPNGMATLIGSIPLTDHAEAMEWITEYTPDIPLWPQLPCIPTEGMLQQFIEGFPGIIEEEDRTFFDTTDDRFSEDILAFFEEYLAVSENSDQLLSSRFAVSRERAAGLYLLKETMEGRPETVAVKGQITGPFTLLTGLHDQDDRAGYYDPTIREMVVKGLAMKAAWQVSFLRKQGLPVILFIDEPALAGLGSSSFVTVSRDDIGQDQTEMIEAIHQAGGLAGIHVCANTDWPLLLSLDFDIINFDAYGYFDRIITCRDELHNFLDRGAIIAWGIVPTSDAEQIKQENPESLAALWEKQAGMLSNSRWDISTILKQSLITPSCGTGSLSPEIARRVLMLTRKVSKILRKKYLK